MLKNHCKLLEFLAVIPKREHFVGHQKLVDEVLFEKPPLFFVELTVLLLPRVDEVLLSKASAAGSAAAVVAALPCIKSLEVPHVDGEVQLEGLLVAVLADCGGTVVVDPSELLSEHVKPEKTKLFRSVSRFELPALS